MKFFPIPSANVVLAFLCISQAVIAQYTLPTDPTRQNVLMPQPDAWQFMRYGDYPVSRETGIPNISIPIYTIKTGELSVPVSISYHAGGIRVDDVASCVGLGWSLNAGGVITRTMRGTPDESTSGILNLEDTEGIHFFDQNGVIDKSLIDAGHDYDHLMKMRDGIWDSEPDIFNYNFNGYSGRFFLDPSGTGEGITQPRSDLKINATISNYQISEIKITAPDGVKYIFNERINASDPDNPQLRGTVSWYLKEIQSPDYPNNPHAEKITFHYRSVSQTFDPLRIETVSMTTTWATGYMPITTPLFVYPKQGVYTGSLVLQRIEFSTGNLVFNYSDDRMDNYHTRLVDIGIYKLNATVPVKFFIFNNGFNNEETPKYYFVTTTLPSAEAVLNKRYKLVSLQEQGSDGQLLPPYQFTYLEQGDYELPPRRSCAQDYWGYKNSNYQESLIPRAEIPLRNGAIAYLGTADRMPHAEKMKAGILNTIKYPTGGITEFSFEANTVMRSRQVDVAPQYYPWSANVNPVHNTEEQGGDSDSKSYPYPLDDPKTVTVSWTVANTESVSDPDVTPPMNGMVVRFTGGGYTVEGSGATHDENARSVSGSQQVTLRPGNTYNFYASTSYDEQTAYIGLSFSDPGGTKTVYENKPIGGLRIKTIKSIDASGTLTQKHFNYSRPGTTHSSGIYATASLPTPEAYIKTTSYDTPDEGTCALVEDVVYSMTAFPANQMIISNCNVINYEYVTETIETSESVAGKSVYQYDVSTLDEGSGAPQTPPMSRGWLRGQLRFEKHYPAGVGVPVKQVEYQYATIDIPETVKGLRIFKIREVQGSDVGGVCIPTPCQGGTSDPDAASCNWDNYVVPRRREIVRLITYTEPIQWKRLAAKIETLDGIITTTTFGYDGESNPRHMNITGVETVNSKGELQKTSIKYAHQMSGAYQELVARNMIGIPLEHEEEIWVDDTKKVTGGSFVTYAALNGNLVPVAFDELVENNSGGKTYRNVKQITRVNSAGQIEEYRGLDGIPVALQWGYNNEFPVMQAMNALAKDIHYESFEESGGTADNNCKTGSRLRAADYTFSLTGLTNGSYRLTYWRKTDGIWTLVTSDVSVTDGSYSTSLAASAAEPIDEVRFYPANSKMITYTAEPLVGIVSMTDSNNMTTYYTYDSFGRLEIIRDNEGNIVKQFQYGYAD